MDPLQPSSSTPPSSLLEPFIVEEATQQGPCTPEQLEAQALREFDIDFAKLSMQQKWTLAQDHVFAILPIAFAGMTE